MRSHQSGVTLMELMTVMVIVGILTAIAYPSYRQTVIRSKRADAKVALQQNAQALENCFTRFHSYNDTANCTIAATLQGGGVASADGNYQVTAATGLDDLKFKLTATPQNGQTADTDCGSFVLDQDNKRDVASATKTPVECWK
ncbi:MAG TPA: type IV pilin protein [Steroidobacteraceae bacterium]|jgi:type IV pilus assembly protein PilE